MTQIVRWVHPKKVNENGTLKPAAFPLAQVLKAMDRSPLGGCDDGTISLASFALLKEENKKNAKTNACGYCTRGARQKNSWNDSEDCDCENNAIGARGACTAEKNLSILHFGLQNAVTDCNPLHVLLCAKTTFEHEDLEFPESVQKKLMDSFSDIRTVKRLFQNFDVENLHK